jgi:Fe-S cluster assembly scaffold protein SufB
MTPEEITKSRIPDGAKVPPAKAQFESEVYGPLKEDLSKQGVIFTDTDTAVREHSTRPRKAKVIPADDNRSPPQLMVWSGRPFIMSQGVKIDFPCRPTSASMRAWAAEGR